MTFYGETSIHFPSTIAKSTYNSGLSDADIEQLKVSPTEKMDLLEEVLTEISVYFGMLYHLIEIFKGHDDFADELSEF